PLIVTLMSSSSCAKTAPERISSPVKNTRENMFNRPPRFGNIGLPTREVMWNIATAVPILIPPPFGRGNCPFSLTLLVLPVPHPAAFWFGISVPKNPALVPEKNQQHDRNNRHHRQRQHVSVRMIKL